MNNIDKMLEFATSTKNLHTCIVLYEPNQFVLTNLTKSILLLIEAVSMQNYVVFAIKFCCFTKTFFIV